MSEAEAVELMMVGGLLFSLVFTIFVITDGVRRVTPFPGPCAKCGGQQGKSVCLCGLGGENGKTHADA